METGFFGEQESRTTHSITPLKKKNAKLKKKKKLERFNR